MNFLFGKTNVDNKNIFYFDLGAIFFILFIMNNKIFTFDLCFHTINMFEGRKNCFYAYLIE